MVNKYEDGWLGAKGVHYASADEAVRSLPRNLEYRLAKLLSDLLKRENFDRIDVYGSEGVDIFATRDSKSYVLEIKIHRSETIANTMIGNAVAQLNAFKMSAKADFGVVVVTQPVDRRAISLPPGIEIWDLPALLARTAPDPHLIGELHEVLRGLQVLTERPTAGETGPRSDPIIKALAQGVPTAANPRAGARIIERLQALKPGRDDAREFERVCQDALQLMFGTEFVSWRAQNEAGDGFHRMDLIARLVPTQNPFWSSIATDFRTRYVIFEFKNYSQPVTQDQIYLTEKYLFNSALRSIAILVARSGKTSSADNAIRGALRDQGKLILCLSLEDICSMLENRDGGGDPTDLLYGYVDDLLMTVVR